VTIAPEETLRAARELRLARTRSARDRYLAMLALLSVEGVSFVIPMTAPSDVAGAIGGASFLGEHVDRELWIGVFLVCGSSALV
jgi:hypothetical protein